MASDEEVLHGDHTVLFLCTGNYYRSRYAEIRLDQWASERGAPWRAMSRGLEVDFEQKTNKGPMSPYAIERLRSRAIDPSPYLWMPRDVAEIDLRSVSLCIAVDRTEHGPMLQERFPAWVDRVEFWDVADGVPTARRHPLAEIDGHLDQLFARLD